MTRGYYSAGDVLFEPGDEGDRLYEVVDGLVRLSAISPAGTESMLTMYHPGGCVGVSQAVHSEPSFHEARATVVFDSVLRELGKADLLQLRTEHPEIQNALIDWSAEQIWALLGLVRSANLFDIPMRLASFLEFLVDDYVQRSGPEAEIVLKISHRVLAGAVGTSRQVVGRLLSQWQVEGILDTGYGRVRVLNRQRLSEIAIGADENA